MEHQVFISYASGDLSEAKAIHDHLKHTNIDAWFAPESIRAGQNWREQIELGIQSSRLLVLLWSKRAAQSSYVAYEIQSAEADGLTFIPIRLDETPYPPGISLILRGVQSYSPTGLNAEALGKIESWVRRELAIKGSAAYPFEQLIGEARATRSGSAQLEALRLVGRFVAIYHVARYLQIRHFTPELNDTVEQWLRCRSLIVDVFVAQELRRHLVHISGADEFFFDEFFKLARSSAVARLYLTAPDRTADHYDLANLHVLLDTGMITPVDTVSQWRPDDFTITAVDRFLSNVLSQEWLRLCSFGVAIPMEGRAPVTIDHLRRHNLNTLGEETALLTRIWLNTPQGPLDLSPFVALARPPDGPGWDIGFFRGQAETASFSYVTLVPQRESKRALIIPPWRTLEIERLLPTEFFAGEEHLVHLRLCNRSSEHVTVGEVVEVLPENVRSAGGSSSISIASPFHLAPGQERLLAYQVVGDTVVGLTRTYPKTTGVEYTVRAERAWAVIGGMDQITVRSLPPPGVSIERRILGPDHSEVSANVIPQGTRLLVLVTIRSCGARIADIKLEEVISGGHIVAGDARIFDGPLDRVDRQPPLTTSYEVLVSGTGEFSIELRPHDGVVSIEAQRRAVFSIQEMPPPKLQLHWQQARREVSSTGCQAILADLIVANVGGSVALGVSVSYTPPFGVAVVAVVPRPNFDLASGTSITVPVRISFDGLPDGPIQFTIAAQSAQGSPTRTDAELRLNQLTGWSEQVNETMFSLGRAATISQVAELLRGGQPSLICLTGERGLGKSHVVQDALDALSQRWGLAIASSRIDCAKSRSMLEALAKAFEGALASLEEEPASGTASPLDLFLRRFASSENDLQSSILRNFVELEQKTANGTWRAVSLALSRLARGVQLDRLVLVLLNVSRFGKKELEDLAELQRCLPGDGRIRIVVTAESPASALGLDGKEIPVDRFSVQQCQELFDQVFLVPRAHATLRNALIEKSERIPSYLRCILEQLFTNKEALLDFTHPLGVHIRDLQKFEQLPRSIVDAERRVLERVLDRELPRLLLAGLGCMEPPLEIARLQLTLQRCGLATSGDQLTEWLRRCREEYQWLVPQGAAFAVRSEAIRAALCEAATPEPCERVHQAAFELHMERVWEAGDPLRHLLSASARFAVIHADTLLLGLRERVNRGSFSAARAGLQQLRAKGVKLKPMEELELQVLQQELKWEETGSLEDHEVDALLEHIRSISGKGAPDLLARLSLVASRNYRRRGDLAKAREIAERCEWHWGPFRRLRITDLQLKFEFFLNLWSIYYESMDERHFTRVDDWIWKHLERVRMTPGSSHEIVRFLSTFLECQRQFSGEEARRNHFPALTMTGPDGTSMPIVDNPIEARTRVERVRQSFFDKLSAETAVGAESSLELGRLYFYRGAMEWADSPTSRNLHGSRDGTPAASVVGGEDSALIPYLLRAEELFTALGAQYDLANTRRKIGESYLDRVRLLCRGSHSLPRPKRRSPSRQRLAVIETEVPGTHIARVIDQGHGDATFVEQPLAAPRLSPVTGRNAELLARLCSHGVKWLRQAAEGLYAADARDEEAECLELQAELLRTWATVDPQMREEAIATFEKLCEHSMVAAQPLKQAEHRSALVQLYEEAGRLSEAALLLEGMRASTGRPQERMLYILAELLLDDPNRIAERSLELWDEDFRFLIQARAAAARSTGIGPDGGEPDQDLSGRRLRAIAVLGWNLARHCKETSNGQKGLSFLRDAAAELTTVPEMFSTVTSGLPSLLAELWNMASSASDVRLRDFVTLIIPITDPSSWDAIVRMILGLWDRDAARENGPRSYSAIEMGLFLCETFLDRPGATPLIGATVQELNTRVSALTGEDYATCPELLARLSGLLLRLKEASRDESNFRVALDHFQSSLRSVDAWDAHLRLLIRLLQCLMQIRTQNDWYGAIISRLAEMLPEAQERSANEFDDITLLIQLYVQLPNRTPDAVELLEQQCERLLDQGNYVLLARYLSFLSDLLSNALQRDAKLEDLEHVMEMMTRNNLQQNANQDGKKLGEMGDSDCDRNDGDEEGDGEDECEERDDDEEDGATDAVSKHVREWLDAHSLETERSKTLRATAATLCGHVFHRLSNEELGRSDVNSVLYNAAKLLDNDAVGDLRCAIYAKLYQLALGFDGATVWGCLEAISSGTSQSDRQFLRDTIALASFSNAGAEGVSGDYGGGDLPRNYLISSRRRNSLIEELSEEDPTDDSLPVAYASLEIKRWNFIEYLIDHLGELTSGLNELETLEFITFIYSYLFRETESLFLPQMMQQINGFRSQIQQIKFRVIEDAAERARKNGHSVPFNIKMHDSPAIVQALLVDNRIRGRKIMAELTERIRAFTLSDILKDVERHLQGEPLKIPYRKALGIWSGDVDRISLRRFRMRERMAVRYLLKMEPALIVPELLEMGIKLLRESEISLAERFYRRALELTDTMSDQGQRFRAEACAGLMRVLKRLGRNDEALNAGTRAVAIYQQQGGPNLDWCLAEIELGDLLISCGLRSEAARQFHRGVQVALSDPQHLAALQQTASEKVLQGRYDSANALLEELVKVRFAMPGTHCLLARSYLLIGNVEEARRNVNAAWACRDEALPSDLLRILWFRLCFACLDAGTPASLEQNRLIAELIGNIKYALSLDGAHKEWMMEAALNEMSEGRLGSIDPDHLDLLAALVSALNHASGQASLDAFIAWREAQPLAVN